VPHHPPSAGGGALLRPLCQALDAYGAQPHLQPPLLRSAAAALEAGAARGLGAPRGGDADPEAAAALLALLAACLRAARRWRQLDAATGDELLRLLGWGVPLAAAGAGSHQRDVCLGALGALGSLLALALERGWPLHAPLLGWAAAEGPTLLQGLLAALLSLNSAAHLPRVGGWVVGGGVCVCVFVRGCLMVCCWRACRPLRLLPPTSLWRPTPCPPPPPPICPAGCRW
jgi:hypothetical protein